MTIYSDALGKQSTFNTNLIAKLQELATAVGNRVRSADLYDGNGKIKSNLLPFAINDLLAALSLAVRVEPGLLRDVRLELGLSMAAELAAWNHADVDHFNVAVDDPGDGLAELLRVVLDLGEDGVHAWVQVVAARSSTHAPGPVRRGARWARPKATSACSRRSGRAVASRVRRPVPSAAGPARRSHWRATASATSTSSARPATSGARCSARKA